MRSRPTDRADTVPLYCLRCLQIGLQLPDLELFDIGFVYDMMTEAGNDEYKGYKQLATQEDMRNF